MSAPAFKVNPLREQARVEGPALSADVPADSVTANLRELLTQTFDSCGVGELAEGALQDLADDMELLYDLLDHDTERCVSTNTIKEALWRVVVRARGAAELARRIRRADRELAATEATDDEAAE